MKARLLLAARADAIPAGTSGLWTVRKVHYPRPLTASHCGRFKRIPAGDFTYLHRQTEATMHLPHGECVMHDTPEELNTHLEFMLRARGHALITGLGLGCVLRGCLANPAVTFCTVIERSQDVINLVAPHLKEDRFKIVVADAREYVRTARRFDCAWHDLWTDEAAGESHLQVVHAGLLADLACKVDFQGAWNFPRDQRRLWRRTPANVL